MTKDEPKRVFSCVFGAYDDTSRRQNATKLFENGLANLNTIEYAYDKSFFLDTKKRFTCEKRN